MVQKYARKKRRPQRKKKKKKDSQWLANFLWLSGRMRIEERRTIERRAAGSMKAINTKTEQNKIKKKDLTSKEGKNGTVSANKNARGIQVRATCG